MSSVFKKITMQIRKIWLNLFFRV